MIESVLFNRRDPEFSVYAPEPTPDQIERTPNFQGASLTDAFRFGNRALGDILAEMPIRGDKRYTFVDTKVSYLMEGWSPAIPGWHTDGVPRGEDNNPRSKAVPNLKAQIEGWITPPRFHLFVSGDHCPTRFLLGEHEFDVETSMDPARDLYKGLDRQVRNVINLGASTYDVCNGRIATWDWWNVHTATQSTGSGWRLLVRVTETDHVPPRTDPDKFIRKQTQVYVEQGFGW